MGNYFSTTQSSMVDKVPKKILKRQRIDSTSIPAPISYDSPTAKRIRTTYDYVYNELFVNGEGSDIVIETPTRSWRLHKLYIKQSPFFNAMFNGAWRDSSTNSLKLDLMDPNITDDALNWVFGSFYADISQLTEENVTSVMAAATWFQLEDIRFSCEEVMRASIRADNVVDLFEAGEQYNLTQLQASCVKWLGRMLMAVENEPLVISLLKTIPKSLLSRILESADTYVIQIEQDLMILLIKWIYLQFHPNYSNQTSVSDLTTVATAFYKERQIAVSTSSECKQYHSLLYKLRWANIINVHKTATSLTTDAMIPQDWLLEACRKQWLRMLLTNEALDPGPSLDLDESVFCSVSERCGRRLSTDLPCSWRWTGFNFGLDMVFRYKERSISVLRFTDREYCEGAVSHVTTRRAFLQLQVASLSSAGDLISQCTTSVLRLNLQEKVQHRLVTLPKDMQFPIVISANILRCDPGLSLPTVSPPTSFDASTSTATCSASTSAENNFSPSFLPNSSTTAANSSIRSSRLSSSTITSSQLSIPSSTTANSYSSTPPISVFATQSDLF